MASIKSYTSRDGLETWRVRYRLHGRSCSKTFKTKDGAEIFGEMIDRRGPEFALAFIKEPTEAQRAVRGVTVEEAVERFITLRGDGSTRRTYRDRARLYINPTLGDVPINKLTPEAVQLWVNSLGVSGTSVRHAQALLSGALALAVERREITSNPAKRASNAMRQGIKIPRTPRARGSVFLTHDEYELVLKSIPRQYQTFVEFLAKTGCRVGEATALTPADVNLNTGKVHFNKSYSRGEDAYEMGATKTEASDREIAVPRRLLDKLDLSGEYVFTNMDGKPINSNSFRTNVWAFAMRRTGLPAHRIPRVHDLRHTHASWLLNDGISHHAIQQRLGHSDVMTTLRTYGHPRADNEEQILAALG
jgi:integrase